MLAIINYNAGNLFSVQTALDRLEQKYIVTSNPKEIKQASKVIFPGVGRASQSMNELKKLNLIDVIKNIKVPFLGICLGAQLLFDFSEEDNTECLGIIPGTVKKFVLPKEFTIPHMGWNTTTTTQPNKLLENIKNENHTYFVHSYYIKTDDTYTLAKTNYGKEFSSIVKKNNFYGVQFHPEKSGEIGEVILKNFLLE